MGSPSQSYGASPAVYAITQCYLPPDRCECAPPLNSSQIGRYSIYLPRRDGRLNWPKRLVTYQDVFSWLGTLNYYCWVVTGLISHWRKDDVTRRAVDGAWRHSASDCQHGQLHESPSSRSSPIVTVVSIQSTGWSTTAQTRAGHLLLGSRTSRQVPWAVFNRLAYLITSSSSSSSTTVGSMPVGVWRHSYYRCPPLPI